jgi:hypothetical protein
MLLDKYIQSVREENRLQRIADYLLRSIDRAYYADSHVALPPQGLGVEAACCAGLALLLDWTSEAALLDRIGLVASKPFLLVDQEWLDELPDAPPPHVLVSLYKTGEEISSDQLCARPTSRDNCPIGDLLTGELRDATVFRLEPSEERESLGGWLFQLDTPATPRG